MYRERGVYVYRTAAHVIYREFTKGGVVKVGLAIIIHIMITQKLLNPPY